MTKDGMIKVARRRRVTRALITFAVLAGLTLLPASAGASDGYEFVSPAFGMDTAPDGSFLVASTVSGISEIRHGDTSLVAELGGASDVAAIGRGNMLALTSEPFDPAFEENAQRLFRVSRGNVTEVANLYEFEVANNPDGIWNPGDPESNPFNLAHLNGGKTLVADAAGNDILYVDEAGNVDWVAVLTPQAICDGTAPVSPFCAVGGGFLPPDFQAQPVATSIAVSPDGDWYAGELTGFPGTPGWSRIWRIDKGSRHVVCPSAACTEVANGLTSIVDLEFGPDGTLYVVEFDAAGWLATEGAVVAPAAGGTVRACDVDTGSCPVIADGLDLPTAIEVAKDGSLWVIENDSIPFGTATVHPLP
jgi:hypothetical protein